MKKIVEKLKAGTLLKYIFWKLGITNCFNLLISKLLDKEVRRWFRDNGDRKYRFDYQIDKNGLIFDLGTYTGNDIKQFSKLFNCKIYGFEPSNMIYKKIKKSELSPNVKIYNFGFSDKNCSAYLINKNDSSYVVNYPPKKNIDYEKIQLKKLSEFINAENINKISLININTEGSEYKILKDLIKSGFIGIVDSLQIQFHRNTFLYPVKKYFIINKLKKTHNLNWEYKYVWERWDRKLT